MIVWAIAMCAAAGFYLGTRCQLLLLAAASALVAASLPLALRIGDAASEAAAMSGPLGAVGLLAVLLAVLQGFFLVGAVAGVSGSASRSAEASLADPPASRTGGS